MHDSEQNTNTNINTKNKVPKHKIFVYSINDDVVECVENLFNKNITKINQIRKITTKDIEDIYKNIVLLEIYKKYNKTTSHLFFLRILDNKNEKIENMREINYDYEIHCIPNIFEIGIDEDFYKNNIETVADEEGKVEVIRNQFIKIKNLLKQKV